MGLKERIERLERPLVDMVYLRRECERVAGEYGLDPDEVLREAESLVAKYAPRYGKDVAAMMRAMAEDNGLDPEEMW